MTYSRHSSGNKRLPLYQRVLGEAWHALPEPIRAMHRPSGNRWEAEGIATVERGNGLLSRLAAALIGLPNAGSDIPVNVSFELKKSGELWRRTFAGNSFKSFQWAGTGNEKLLMERFGVLTLGLALVFDGRRLNLVVRSWSMLGIPLPSALAPAGQTYEFVEQGRFHFHVEISHPLTGLIVRYCGWLVLSNRVAM